MEDLVLLNHSRDFHFDMAKKVSQYLSKLVIRLSSESSTRDNNFLQELIKEIILVSAKISVIVCNQSISVYNDDLEAYLIELKNNEIQKRCANMHYKSLEDSFNELLEDYKKIKSESFSGLNQANEDLNSLTIKLDKLLLN